MNKEKFYKMFLDLIDNVENRYHPLVWIHGKPDIGKGTYIGGFSEINAKNGKVSIGNKCDIASFVAINVADSHRLCIGLSNVSYCSDITIEDCVFIGSHSVILGGTHIGHHSVIGAGTVVRPGVIPPYSLVLGNPMIIKSGYYRKEFEEVRCGQKENDSP